MSEIRNTTAEMSDPNSGQVALMLALGMSGDSGTDAFIAGQERAGQLQLVRSQMLPAKILHCTQADFEAFGFVFGDVDADDPLFRQVTLPAGWSKRGTDHDMWSHIVDEHGRQRAEVFYKAAWYDRKAHMWLTTLVGYVQKALWDGVPVVLDESWATPAAIVEAAQAIAADREESLGKLREFAAEDGPDGYWAKRVLEVEAERDQALALARLHGEASDA